jgi:hypothetical protein
MMGRSALGWSVFAAVACAALASSPGVARADRIDACIGKAEEGQRLRVQGKLTRARESILACSQAECPSVVRSDCSRWLAEVDGLIPSLVIRAVDSTGADVVDVQVAVDDQVIAERLDGSEIHVDPGEHVFRFTRAGSAPVQQNVLVREAEKHRTLSVVFPATPAAGASHASTGTEADHRTEDRASPQGASSQPRVPLAWPVAILGAGGVALGVASYLWISGLSDHSSLVSTCGPQHDCSTSAVDAAHGKLVAGDIVGGAGIALGAIGVGILVFGRGSAPPTTAIALHPVAGGAVLGLRGSL